MWVILAGQRLDLLLRHPVAVTGLINLALATTAPSAADGKAAFAGALAAKKTVPASAGTFPTTGPLFVGLVVGTIVIVGGLTFFPALALGPIVEHIAMTAGQLF